MCTLIDICTTSSDAVEVLAAFNLVSSSRQTITQLDSNLKAEKLYTMMLSSKELAKLSQDAFADFLKSHGKPKERSQTTFENVHRPALEALNKALSSGTGLTAATAALSMKGNEEGADSKPDTFNGLQTLLIGDSLLEHLKTLPSDLQSLGKDNNEPSLQTDLIGSSSIERSQQQSIRIAAIHRCLNLGVGGDRIENILYRLSLGTYSLLLPHSPHLRLVIVQVGTNNLGPKRSLKPNILWKYGLLIQALLRIAPKAQVLCSGLFRRKDVPDRVMAESVSGLRGVVEDLNGNGGEGGIEGCNGRVRFVEAPELGDEDMVDHVHLNRGGYALWDQVLWPIVEECLEVEGFTAGKGCREAEGGKGGGVRLRCRENVFGTWV